MAPAARVTRAVLAGGLALNGVVAAALSGPPVQRDPDARVDVGRGYYTSTTAEAPRVFVDGERVYAVFLDARYSAASAEPYFVASVNQGGTWNTSDRRLNKENPGTDAGDHSNVFVRGGGDAHVYTLMVGVDPQKLQTRVSTDYGETWRAAVDIAVDGTGDPVQRTGFTMAASPGGKGFIGWSDDHDVSNPYGQPDYSIYLRRTLDGGASWQSAQRVNHKQTCAAPPFGVVPEKSREPALCADGGPRLYAVWTDRRNKDVCQYTEVGGRIVFRYSTDNGATFLPGGAETRLDTDDDGTGAGKETRSAVPAIACNSSNLVAVAWEDERDGTGDWNIFSNVSADGGATWRAHEVRVDVGAPAAKSARNPKIAQGGGRIYVAWEDDRNAGKDIYFAYSADAGGTWSAPALLNAGVTPGAFPVESWDLGADGTSVVVAWVDNRNGGAGTYRDPFAVRSTDGGASFGPVQRLDLGSGPGAADTTQLDAAASGAGYVAVYRDLRTDAARGDIYGGGYGSSYDFADPDGDGVSTAADNCPQHPNAGQADRDSDGAGDACDAFENDPDNDGDRDGFPAGSDNCPLETNAVPFGGNNQLDSDGDGWGDECDLCSGADTLQRDLDADNTGDRCDTDTDGDGQANTGDSDDDNDGVADTTDNCDFVKNKRQLNNDADGTGDDCDENDLIVSAVQFAADPHDTPWSNKSRVFWDNEPAASRYIVRFRAVDDAGAARAWMCYAPDLQHYAAHWEAAPDPGQAMFFVVTGKNAGGAEGSPGRGADGTERWSPAAAPACTAALAADWDSDGLLNGADNCRFDANAGQQDWETDGLGDACDADDDDDGVRDAVDNCAYGADPQQTDADADGVGDACDDCRSTPNPGQTDGDGDRVGDACDICPAVSDPAQQDADRDGAGDACDGDLDGDGLANAADPDDDNDGAPDGADRCPTTADARQLDQDADGTGDACDFDDREINGVLVRKNSAGEELTWVREVGATTYSVYSDLAGALAPGGVYGQCLTFGMSLDYFDVSGLLTAGQARYFLVTGVFGGAEGTAGRTSGGAPRAVPAGCP